MAKVHLVMLDKLCARWGCPQRGLQFAWGDVECRMSKPLYLTAYRLPLTAHVHGRGLLRELLLLHKIRFGGVCGPNPAQAFVSVTSNKFICSHFG